MVYKSILFFTGWCVVCFTFLLSCCLCYKLTPVKLLQHWVYMGVLRINLKGWCFLHKGSDVLVVCIHLWSDTCWSFWQRSSKDGLTVTRIPDRADGLGAHVCSCLFVCLFVGLSVFYSLILWTPWGSFGGLTPSFQMIHMGPADSTDHSKRLGPADSTTQTPTWCGLDPERLCGL